MLERFQDYIDELADDPFRRPYEAAAIAIVAVVPWLIGAVTILRWAFHPFG